MRVTYMYEMYEHSINTAKVSTSFHIETKLLFKVFAKTDLYDKDLSMQQTELKHNNTIDLQITLVT